MIEILEKLFGSGAKVKIMRLFLFNPHASFSLIDIAERSQVAPVEAKRTLTLFEDIGLVKQRHSVRSSKKHSAKKSHKKEIKFNNTSSWSINKDFSYLRQLRELLLYPSPVRDKEILTRLARSVKLRLVILSGVFLQNLDARIDMLIVGDNVKKTTLSTTIKKIESELGREIKYAAFETADFKYRMNMYDKLVRDVLDYPHEKILDKIGL